ncbi:MAG: antibiotic biosynthesis monooxygenase [Pseudomonadales bacterium]
MATLLAHIVIRPGAEGRWEAMIQDLVSRTLASEPGALRYEYWKGQAPRSYYGLLSFTDKAAFFAHQDASYHRNQPYGEVIESIRLEVVDPVSGASPLPRTRNPALPDDAPAGIREWEQLTPLEIADWWRDRN